MNDKFGPYCAKVVPCRTPYGVAPSTENGETLEGLSQRQSISPKVHSKTVNSGIKVDDVLYGAWKGC